ILHHRDLIQRGEAFIVLRDGQLVVSWTKHSPPPPQDIRQLTSFVAAFALGRALEANKLRSLDQPLHELFPEWKQGRKQTVTLRHVLEHSTGLLADDAPSPQQDILRMALAAELVDAPGSR